MNAKYPAPASTGLNLGDIYHVLFRHKWKILIIWALGLITAAAIWYGWPVTYQSQAQILIKYVLDNKTVAPLGSGDIQTPDSRGDSIVNSEMVILQSLDTALPAADAVGPSNVLAKLGGGMDRYRAAQAIKSGLKVDAAKGGAVMFVSFEHPDPVIAQTVLTRLIENYVKRSSEIRQAAGAWDDYLQRQTADLQSRLDEKEKELRQAKSSVNVLSLDETKKAYTELVARIQGDLASTEAELAERVVTLNEMTNLLYGGSRTNASSAPEPVPTPQKDQYEQICQLLKSQKTMLQSRLVVYAPENERIVSIQNQIAETEKRKAQMETNFPDLLASGIGQPAGDDRPMFSRMDLFKQNLRVRELQTHIDTLKQTLKGIQTEISNVNDKEGMIVRLERQGKQLESALMAFSANLLNASLQEQAGPGRITNIGEIQKPSPAVRDLKKLNKTLVMTLLGALIGGLALAFATELYLDRSFKRPIEIENRLGVPLFLSIPRTSLNGKNTLLNGSADKRLLTQGGSENGNHAVAVRPQAAVENPGPWNRDHKLRPFFETLRDRLIMYFEVRNLTHKPKLVAVTSCGQGSGVSTVASGLAASLSETGDGNVLLVDMNEMVRGASAYFHKGKLECGLDDALEKEKREGAMVHENLYVVAENAGDDRLPRILHKRFSNLMPKLRASDYDYIIFDMPPVSQISPTPRLARFMDMVFMVVEAEKTDRDVVKRATDMLEESKATVGVVFNKQRSYVPKALQQEL